MRSLLLSKTLIEGVYSALSGTGDTGVARTALGSVLRGVISPEGKTESSSDGADSG